MASEWFYFKGDQRIGPVGSRQLKELASEKEILPTDFVWKDGMSKPEPAAKFKGLFEEVETNASKQSSGESPRVQVSEPPPKKQIEPPSNEQAEESPGTEWYYAQGNEHCGPVKLPELQDLARSGKLQLTDLVWHEALPDWVPASRIADLFPPNELMRLKGVFAGTAEIFKQGWFEGQQTSTAESPKDSVPETSSSEDSVPVVAEVETPPRLPPGVSINDVIIQNKAAYRGGHPQQTESGEGSLYLASNGLHFIAFDPSHDLTIPYGQVLDILTPMIGTFSQEMIEKAESARSISSVGRHLSHFAGALVGGVGGAAIRAIGSTATGVSASQSSLGVPPKNRLVVVVHDNSVRHKLIFDVMSSEKMEMEQQADAFWRKVATVRSQFFNANAKQRPAIPQSTGGAMPQSFVGAAPLQSIPTNPVPSTTSAPLESHGFYINRRGAVTGPHSDAEIKGMMERGEFSGHDSIRIEVWVPVATIGLLNMAIPSGIGIALRSPGTSGVPTNPTSPRLAATGTSTTQPQRTLAPVIAAGVGGLVAGTVASSLLSPGTAQAASISRSPHHHDFRIQGVVVDSDGDGIADTAGLDTNHDGQIDAVGIDYDEDGHADAIGADLDHDGHLDTYGFDVDGDGHLDVIAHDYDEDGEIDDYEEV